MESKYKRAVTGRMLTMLLAFFAVSSLADEAALYDLAPEGSAFLRIIDLRKSTSDNLSSNRLTLRIKNKRLSTAAYCSASKFIYLPAGAYHEEINGIHWKGALKPNKAYSLVVDNNSAKLLTDYRADNSRRAVLAVYNFSDYSQLSLETARSAQLVFNSIPQGQSTARAINPLKSAFAVIDQKDIENKSLAVTDAMIFQPGVLSSLFICADKEGVYTRWADSLGADQWL